MHANELYRRNNDGSLPDWKLEESDSLEYRWQPYEDPAPEMPKHRGRDVRYCAVNQRKYDWGKGQFREGVCEELGVDRRMVWLRPSLNWVIDIGQGSAGGSIGKWRRM